MGNLINGPLALRKFKPPDLPGLLWAIPFDEQSGNGSANRVSNASGRPLANLLSLPENSFGTTPWGSSGSASTETASADTDPVGGTQGFRSNITGVKDFFQTVNLPAGAYSLSIYARNFSGSAQTLRLSFTTGSTVYQSLATTANWQRFVFNVTAATAVTRVGFNTSGAGDYSVWGAQLEASPAASEYIPNSYDVRLVPLAATATVSTAGVTFNGTTNYAVIAGPAIAPATGTLYLVCRTTATTFAESTFFTNADSQRQMCILLGNGNKTIEWPGFRFWNSSTIFQKEATLTNADHVVSMVRSATGFQAYVDGCCVAYSTSLMSVASASQWFLGRGPASSMYAGGLVAGLYLYGADHSYEQVLRMTQHLRSIRVSMGRVTNPATHMILMEGDSLTLGTTSVTGKGWTKLTMESLSSGNLPGIQGVNVSINGSTVTTTSVSTRLANLAKFVSPPGSRRIFTVWFGANDLRSAVSATVFLSDLKILCTAMVQAGYRVVVATVIAGTSLDNTVRATANAEIRNSANVGVCWHAVADVAADANIGANGQETNLTYFDADQFNLKDAGYAIAAGIFTTAILTQM